MPQISYSGAFTAGPLNVPDVYLNILPPSSQVIRPAIFGLLGIVGTGTWGPANSATIIGSMAQLNAYFGYPSVRANDLVTAATMALEEQGTAGLGANLMLVRVTDGTDVAASYLVQSTSGTSYAMKLTALYTGTRGNAITATLSTGSKANSWRLVLNLAPFAPEVYDNITGSGATLWTNLVAAINSGQGVQRGASQLCVASAGAGANASATPVAGGPYTLTGGVDGTTTITSSVLIGTDSVPRTGMYAFRNSGVSDLMIADFSDLTQSATVIAFAQSEGIYFHLSGPPSETPSQAQTSKNTNGSDNPWLKRWVGDWGYWQDTYNQTERFLAPATFGAALISTVPPMLTVLNRPSRSITATQRSRGGLGSYGGDELAVMMQAGLDVICNPIPAGNMFGGRTGRNASSSYAINGDNWPRLTSYLARSLTGTGALGTLIGQAITPDFFRQGYDMIDSFLGPLASPLNGPQVIEAYSILFDRSNNPPSQTAKGLVVAQVNIRFLGVATVFLVNCQTGQTVVVAQGGNVQAAVAALAAAA